MAFDVIPYEEWGKMGQYVQLEDCKVFYVHKGKGFPLVIGHSFGRNSWWYCRVLDTLAKEYSVYVMDNPGYARSSAPPLYYSIPDFAAAVKEFMDKMGIDRAHYLGTSGSSQIGTALATTWPSRVAKLILDCPVRWTRTEGIKHAQEMMANMIDDYTPKPWKGRENRQAFPGLDGELLKLALDRNATDFDVHAKWQVASQKEQYKYDVNPRHQLIQAPTLWLAGDACPPDYIPDQKLVDAVRGSRMAIIKRGGVLVCFEQPEIYSKLVLDFLRTPN